MEHKETNLLSDSYGCFHANISCYQAILKEIEEQKLFEGRKITVTHLVDAREGMTYVHAENARRMVYLSLLMSVFGIFEFYLTDYCLNLSNMISAAIKDQKSTELHQQFTPMKGKYLSHALDFLRTLLKGEKRVFKESESIFKKLNTIRNCVAHNGSKLSLTTDDKLNEQIRSLNHYIDTTNNGLSYDENKNIVVSNYYLSFVVDQMKNYFQEIDSLIQSN